MGVSFLLILSVIAKKITKGGDQKLKLFSFFFRHLQQKVKNNLITSIQQQQQQQGNYKEQLIKSVRPVGETLSHFPLTQLSLL